MKTRMKIFYKVTFNADTRNAQVSVVDYNTASFDIANFWRGLPYDEIIPPDVRLYVNGNKPVKPDFMANPISWPICSERLVEIIQARGKSSIQVFNAPLFESKNKTPFEGYKVLNIVKLIPCLDMEKSLISFSDDKTEIVDVVNPVYIEQTIPDNAHIFRVVGDIYRVIISSELLEDFVREKVTGMSVIECNAP